MTGSYYVNHPLAGLFPLIEGPEFDKLTDDIRDHGLREPITLFGGEILDGRNRHRACLAAGIEPRFEEYTGDDPLGFVISRNLRRRHLDENQRAMVAAKIADLPKGANQHTPIGVPSQAAAAEMMNVGHRSVQRAAHVKKEGAPELVAAVEKGEVSVSAAAEVVKLQKEDQRKLVGEGPTAVAKAAKDAREEKKKPVASEASPGKPEHGIEAYRDLREHCPEIFRPTAEPVDLRNAWAIFESCFKAAGAKEQQDFLGSKQFGNFLFRLGPKKTTAVKKLIAERDAEDVTYVKGEPEAPEPRKRGRPPKVKEVENAPAPGPTIDMIRGDNGAWQAP
jgi:hypothetical protein